MSRQPFEGPSPFQQGHAHGAAGGPLPPAPAHWSNRAAGMYASGYEQARDQLARRALATLERLRPILADLLAYQANEFEAVCLDCDGSGHEPAHLAQPGCLGECETCGGSGVDEDRDLSVSGADLVDAFTAWRDQIKAALKGEA